MSEKTAVTEEPIIGVDHPSRAMLRAWRRRSWWGGLREGAAFRDVERFCLFVGYARSGHSLVGALLDAHPEAVISHELDALDFLRRGFSRRQIYWLILQNTRAFAANGRTWEDYSYAVPGGWQGRHTTLRVIGDKKGSGTTMHLAKHPELLDQLRRTVGVPIRIVHVMRNPWDNIATRVRRNPRPGMDHHLAHHFELCDTIARLRGEVGQEELLDLRHEDVIADARGALTRLTGFLGLSAPDEYLAACHAMVYESPNRSRHRVEWTDAQRALVAEHVARLPFLAEYTFES